MNGDGGIDVDESQEGVRNPLTPEDTAQLAAAIDRSAKLRKTAKTAAINGWVLAISAAFTAPFAPFGAVSFLLFIALSVLAWNVFRGRKMLEAFDEAGPALLWKNELGLMVVVMVYCTWGIWNALAGPVNPSLAELDVVLPDVVGLMGELTATIYVVVLLSTVVFQGAMARYYYGRIAMVRDYLADTPEWTVEVVRIVQGGAARTARSAEPGSSAEPDSSVGPVSDSGRGSKARPVSVPKTKYTAPPKSESPPPTPPDDSPEEPPATI